ncbi:CD48 antigen [Xiphophorus maculatus]|uniref:CD48 antigen n=1 Tax=Xiphophorus maculatus TaxID=8083 RepID=UPI000C6D27A2|nr:CD48 antigen [Xiphophorus maculatus]
MKAVIKLQLILIGVCSAGKPSCDGRQNGAQCFGVLGGAVDVQLVDNVSEIPRFLWNTNNSVILYWRYNKVVLKKDGRIPFFPSNGSVTINDLRRTDSGEYKLEMFDGNGKITGRKTLQLFVIAAVSSVQLVPECLSQGQMKVSFVSQGDSPQYSWALDGHTLTDSELFSRNTETNIIVLRRNISGHLVCSVRNPVSNSSEEMNIAVCEVKTSCDGRQNGAQCFGVLGGVVDVQLMDNVSEIPRFLWKMNNSRILYWRYNVLLKKDDRIPFFPSNGSVRISDLRRTDSGEYKLEMFDGNGKNTGWKTLQLFVIAAVSSVQLVPECLSQGQMKVSCVSQGDSPQYSWALDGHNLTDSELFSRNTETNIIVLRKNISGHLVCSVRNPVSNSSEEMNIAVCEVKTSCDGRQNGAQCFGVLGGVVDVQLMDNVSEITKFKWNTNKSVILYWRYNKVVLKKDDRIPFFPSNGSVRINNLRRTDSGEYKLEMFDGDGKNTGWKTLQLFVIAAVSSVQLVPECLSQGHMKVSCVSQGDSPQYSWALDGHTLTDSELFSRNTETNIIVLRRNISGHLVCSVKNPVSNSSEEMNIAVCVKTSCDGRQNGAQCFGVLGGVVDVQLMDNVSEIPRFLWKMNNSRILYWKNNKVVSPKDDRIPFFPSDGSVRINDLRRTDSGEYKLEMFDGNGKNTGWKTLQLFVIAPVSSVQLVTECLSQGQMKVSCVSQGDSPQYSWALDGHTLTDSELFSRNTETNIIVLRQNISGHLVCSVKNPVSNSSEGMNLTYCVMDQSGSMT